MAMANRELNTAEIAYAAIGEVSSGVKKKEEKVDFNIIVLLFVSSPIHFSVTQGAKHQIHKGAAIQGIALSSPAAVQWPDSGGRGRSPSGWTHLSGHTSQHRSLQLGQVQNTDRKHMLQPKKTLPKSSGSLVGLLHHKRRTPGCDFPPAQMSWNI